MASGFGSVGSVLTERPPSDSPWTTTNSRGPVPAHPPAAPSRPMPGHPGPAQHGQPGGPAYPGQAAAVGPAAHPAPKPAGPRADRGSTAGNRAWYDSLLSGRQYDVVYDDAEGYPLLAFADGQWYDVTSFTPQPVTVRHAMRMDPAWAGAIVQTVCMWTRGNPNHDRSFELATELALAVGELARQASG
jgi:hypothetical protein